MNLKTADVHSNEERPRWSMGSMLSWGTFGTHTPAERRFIIRSAIAALTVVGWALLDFATGFRPKPAMTFITALLPGPALTYIAYEWRRYVSTLDELARRLQFEAAAWTYITGLVLAMWLGGISVIVRWPHYPKLLVPWVLVSVTFFLFGLLEPIRCAYLYFLSRRY
jgi:hypothetical protein